MSAAQGRTDDCDAGVGEGGGGARRPGGGMARPFPFWNIQFLTLNFFFCTGPPQRLRPLGGGCPPWWTVAAPGWRDNFNEGDGGVCGPVVGAGAAAGPWPGCAAAGAFYFFCFASYFISARVVRGPVGAGADDLVGARLLLQFS